jgi:hypothetical protein
MILPALIAKFLSAGAIAQAATGATVAVVAFTGVGVVGALPDPVQDTFATVVAEITPLEPPTSEEPSEEPTEEVVPEVAPEETVVEEIEDVEPTVESPEVPADAEALAAQVKEWALTGPAEGESISDWASKGSTADVKGWLRAHGMTFGNVVSAHASGKGFSEEERAALGADEQPVDAPTEPVTDEVSEEVSDEVSESDDTEVAATKDSGSRGNGNGNGKGNGNGGGNGRGNAKN